MFLPRHNYGDKWRGLKKLENLGYVIYGCPLFDLASTTHYNLVHVHLKVLGSEFLPIWMQENICFLTQKFKVYG